MTPADKTNDLETCFLATDRRCHIMGWRLIQPCKPKMCGVGLLVFFSINSSAFPSLGREIRGHKPYDNAPWEG